MSINEYKEIIKETTLHDYPTYYQDKILRGLKEKKIIFNDKRFKNEENLLDVTEYIKSDKKLEYIIKNLDRAIKEIEIFEYDRAYRYCSIFSISNYSDELLSNLKKSKKVNEFSDDINNIDDIKSVAMNPTYRMSNEKTIFKFSFLLENKDNNKRIKYPVLAIIHKDVNALEIRLDTVQFAYRNNETFYKDKIDDVVAWIKSILNLGILKEENKVKIENINFETVVKYMRAEKIDEVTIVALRMRREGMMAYLDSSANEDLMIPILGELKGLLVKEEDIFNKNEQTIDIKNILTKFIKEIEETSSLPSVKVLWGDKKIKVLLTHEYQKGEYTLFKYSDELGDGEMMDYVTRYVIGCKREVDEQFDN